MNHLLNIKRKSKNLPISWKSHPAITKAKVTYNTCSSSIAAVRSILPLVLHSLLENVAPLQPARSDQGAPDLWGKLSSLFRCLQADKGICYALAFPSISRNWTDLEISPLSRHNTQISTSSFICQQICGKTWAQCTHSSLHPLNLYGMLLKNICSHCECRQPSAYSNLTDKHVTMETTKMNAFFSKLGHNPKLFIPQPNVSFTCFTWSQQTFSLSKQKYITGFE